MGNEILKGKKVYLVPIGSQDTENIIKWRNQPFVREMFLQGELLTEEIHQNWLKTMVRTQKVRQFIIYLKGSDRPIGMVFLKNIDREKKMAEYGNFIGESEYLGRGYGSDAGSTLLKYAFEELKLHKIFLRVKRENERAIKAYRKMGFTEAETLFGHVDTENVLYMVIEKTELLL